MSSHREAPEMSKDPVADSTDLYAFVSPDAPTTATLIANYVPLQAPDGGPNFYEFGSDVLYEIHIDNNGDALADVTYQFRFTSVLTNPKTFLYNDGPITITDGRLEAKYWNRRQYFSVTKVVGKKSTVLASKLACPPCNIGPLSTPNYADEGADGGPEDFTKAFIYTLPTGEKVFAGQRAEGFYVDLGAVFDLGDLRPLAQAHAFGGSMLSMMDGVNSTSAVNVHSIAIQVPIKGLTKTGTVPTNAALTTSVIGVWTTASRQTATMRNATGTPTYSGPYVQVSRLGNPLFNEVLVPIAKKDEWNASPPSGDKEYASGVDNPELAQLLPVLYPGAFPNLAAYNALITNGTKSRADLDAILLTGIPAAVLGGTITTETGATKADMLRLNLAVAPTDPSSSAFSVFGLAYGDVAGFPNGRRVFDDVTTIELQAVAGLTIPLVDPSYTKDAVVTSVTDGLVSSATDVTAKGSVSYLSSFPYLGTPHSGYYTPSVTPPASNG
jgi:hypothetical protein